MPLTDKTCKNAKPAERPYKLADGGGLYLEVAANGGRYWRLKYRFKGKEKRLAFGVYPAVLLAEAREQREVARKLLASEQDPGEVEKERKRQAALNNSTTFEAVAREWHERNLGKWTTGYGADILHRLETDVFPEIGSRPVADVTPVQVLSALRKIEKRGAQEMARRTQQYCGQIFRYAVVTGRSDRNPAADLRGALKPPKRKHFAAIEPKELPEFVAILNQNNARLFVQTRLAIRLMMLTFVRTSELIKAKWDEIDLDAAEWSIPADRMKMKRPHLVPLARQSVEILKELQALNGSRDWVFASVAKPRQHMSNNTILKALERLGYKGRMTGHGFRALAMTTIKEKLKFPHEVVDRQLAHAPRNQVDAAYDRTKYLDERRKMMQKWADYLDGVGQSGLVISGRFLHRP